MQGEVVSPNMRIGIMCHSSFGGSALIAIELADELAKRGHRVHLFSRTTPFNHWNSMNGVVIHTIAASSGDPVSAADLHVNWSAGELEAFQSNVLMVSQTEGLDVLHFHYAVPFSHMSEVIRSRMKVGGPMLVGTLHGTDVSVHGKQSGTGPNLGDSLRHLDALTTVSESHARLASEVFGLDTTPQVIPNFVNLSRFRPRAGNGHELEAHDRPRIAHVSNFRPVKRAPIMARVFLSIRERINADLWLIGDGMEMDAVRAIFNQRAVNDHVTYWGLQNDIPKLLAQTDLLLVTSETESFCLAALEAMACGVPVLAPRVGGLPEVVVDGESGILFEVDDFAYAADAAVQLLSDPSRLQTMRETAIRHAGGFSHEEGVDSYETLYRQLLGAGTNGWTSAPTRAAPVLSSPFDPSAQVANEE